MPRTRKDRHSKGLEIFFGRVYDIQVLVDSRVESPCEEKALQSISLCLVFCQLDFPVTDILYLIFCTSVVTRETWKSYILPLSYCCGQQRTKPTDSWRAFCGFAALLTRPATDRNLSLFCQHSLPFIVFKRSPLHFYQLN